MERTVDFELSPLNIEAHPESSERANGVRCVFEAARVTCSDADPKLQENDQTSMISLRERQVLKVQLQTPPPLLLLLLPPPKITTAPC